MTAMKHLPNVLPLMIAPPASKKSPAAFKLHCFNSCHDAPARATTPKTYFKRHSCSLTTTLLPSTTTIAYRHGSSQLPTDWRFPVLAVYVPQPSQILSKSPKATRQPKPSAVKQK